MTICFVYTVYFHVVIETNTRLLLAYAGNVNNIRMYITVQQ